MIFHDSRLETFRRPFGAAETSAPLYLAARCPEAGEMTLRLRAFTGPDRFLPMAREEGDLFSVSFSAPDTPCVLWYTFLAAGQETAPRQLTVYDPAPAPEWWKKGVVYQIFPDRFARETGWTPLEPAKRKGSHRFLIRDWDTPVFYPRNEKNDVTSWPFWGGTLRGIREKLPYLRSLGVTVLYLNPIFEAVSNHRYDTADYTRIDPLLGTEEDFRDLCADAEARGMRIVLDGVFNHTGADSVYFDACGNYGTGGAYRSWYRFGPQYTHGYECWWDFKDLPNVEENDPSYRQFICGEDGVVRRWLRLGASGWRLDVADELPDSFIRDVRTAMKAEKPDGMLMGEVWEDATNKVSYGELREYFLGHELDSTMHYPFRELTLDFLRGKIDAAEACERLWTIKENYPRENQYAVMNLIGSHDRERALTLLNDDRDLFRLAFFLQFALPGVPCVYYGDEAGMTGGADPYNRAPFPWGREDAEMTAYMRTLTAEYAAHPALTDGEYEPVSFGADVLGCRRDNGVERLLALVNRSGQPVECFGVTVSAKGRVLCRENG